MWFTAASTIGKITPAGVITEFSPPTNDSGPNRIIAGPDGSIWFTESTASRIDRVNLPATPATPTPTVTPVPPTSTPGGPCIGDCDESGSVGINELILGVNIVLGTTLLSACPAFDPNGTSMVTIANLIAAVGNALNGCPP